MFSCCSSTVQLLVLIFNSPLKILEENIILAENLPGEFLSSRVRTLDGQQLQIFEARMLTSYINVNRIYIFVGWYEKNWQKQSARQFSHSCI
jgi:hypothetical protein